MNKQGSLKITIISFSWPPRNSIAVHRAYSWAKYWSEAGMDIHVLTAKKYAYDEPLDSDLPNISNIKVTEVDYLEKNGLLSQKPQKVFFHSFLKRTYRAMRAFIPIKNPREKWFNATAPLFANIAFSSDVIVSTYDPKTCHLIAAEIKKINPKLLWVADYRDLWSQNHMSKRSKVQKKKECQAESEAVGKYSDVITSVSDELTEKLATLHSKQAYTITNGFDISKDILRGNLKSNLIANEPKRIVYTGKIYPDTRDPTPLIECIFEAEQESLIQKGSIEVHIYGSQVEDIASLSKRKEYSDILKIHGHVRREVALSAQVQADIVLLLESPSPDASGVLTGKVFEYIGSGTPILSLGSLKKSAIGKLLESTQCGICLENNKAEIKQLLKMLEVNSSLEWFDPVEFEVMKYSRENQAEKMLSIILQKNKEFRL